jgi:hypothetical protein
MPSKLAIAFLGMVVGGSAFMFAGLRPTERSEKERYEVGFGVMPNSLSAWSRIVSGLVSPDNRATLIIFAAISSVTGLAVDLEHAQCILISGREDLNVGGVEHHSFE